MLRLVCRAVLVITIALAPVAASAECAWVLWEDTVLASRISTEPVRAYSTKPECDRALSDALGSFTSSPGMIVSKNPKDQEVYVTRGKSTTGYRYVCLPDTVDPRKAK
jgi:hypothetical protein